MKLAPPNTSSTPVALLDRWTQQVAARKLPRPHEQLFRNAHDWQVAAKSNVLMRLAGGFVADLRRPVLRAPAVDAATPRPAAQRPPTRLLPAVASLVGALVGWGARAGLRTLLSVVVGLPVALARLLCGYWLWRAQPALVEFESFADRQKIEGAACNMLADELEADKATEQNLQAGSAEKNHPQFFLDLQRDFQVVVQDHVNKPIALSARGKTSADEQANRAHATCALEDLTCHLPAWQRQVTQLTSQVTPLAFLAALSVFDGPWRLGGHVWEGGSAPMHPEFLHLFFNARTTHSSVLSRLPNDENPLQERVQAAFAMHWSAASLRALSATLKTTQLNLPQALLQLHHPHGVSLNFSCVVGRPTQDEPVWVRAYMP